MKGTRKRDGFLGGRIVGRTFGRNRSQTGEGSPGQGAGSLQGGRLFGRGGGFSSGGSRQTECSWPSGVGLRGGGDHRAGTGDQGRQDLPSGGERGFRASVSGVGGSRSMVLLRKPSLIEIHKPSPGSASPYRCEFLSGNFVAEQRAPRRGGRFDGDRLLRLRGAGPRWIGYREPTKKPRQRECVPGA